MARLTTLFLSIIVFLTADAAAGQPLIVSFGSHDAEPYAFIENEQLVGGIIKDIMDEVGKEIGIEIRYKNIPRKRMDLYLLSGKVHIRLISSPCWSKNPKQYQWSVPLFKESGRYVVSAKNAFPIILYDDLKGKRLGTILGYQYPAGLTDRFDARDIIRDDAKTLEANFKRLMMNRIDCLIDADIPIAYYLKKHQAHEEFVIAEKVDSTHDIQAMMSLQMPVSCDRINAVFQQLKDSGKVRQILHMYK